MLMKTIKNKSKYNYSIFNKFYNLYDLLYNKKQYRLLL